MESQSTMTHSERPIDKLFLKMAVIYGSRWNNMWANVPPEIIKQEWQSKLQGKSSNQVFKAAEYCAKNKDFPPTLPEFIAICKQYEARDFNVALPKPAHTPEQVQQNKDRLEKEIAKLKPKTDHKKWAKDILKEAEEGLYKFDLGIKFANEALGIKA